MNIQPPKSYELQGVFGHSWAEVVSVQPVNDFENKGSLTMLRWIKNLRIQCIHTEEEEVPMIFLSSIAFSPGLQSRLYIEKKPQHCETIWSLVKSESC